MKRATGTSLSARVLKTMSIFGGVQCLSILCSIVRAKLAAILIGPAGVGLLAIYNSTMDMLSSTNQLNLRQSAVRELSAATNSERPRLVAVVRKLAVTLGLIGMVAVALFSPIISLATFDTWDYWPGFLVLSLVMVLSANSSAELAILQGFNRLKTLASANLYNVVISTVITVILYYFIGIYAVVPVLLTFQFAQYYFTRRGTHRELDRELEPIRVTTREAFKSGRGILSLGVSLTVSSFTCLLASYLFLVWLNRTASTEIVGIYQSGYMLINSYVGVIFNAIAMEYFPRLTENIKHVRRSSTVVSHEISICLWVLIPIVVVFISCAHIIVQIIYTQSFVAMLPFITLAIIGVLLRAVSWCIAYVILAKGDGRTYIVSETLSAAIGLTLNILGYKYFGWMGLGVSYVLWYMCYTVIVFVIYRWRYRMRIARGIWAILALGLFISALTLVLYQYAWWLPLVALLPWLLPIAVKKLLHR